MTIRVINDFKNEKGIEMTRRFYTILLIIVVQIGQIKAQDTILDAYIGKAISSSNEIIALDNEKNSMQQQIKTSTRLQDIELSVDFLPKPMQNVNGEQIMSLSAMQMFPSFGVLRSQKKKLQCSTIILDYKKQEIINKIVEQVRLNYYDIMLLNEKIKITKEKIALFDKIEESATQKIQSGASISPILNIKLQKEELNLQFLNLSNEIETAKKNFNILLHQDIETEIIFLDTIIEQNVLELNMGFNVSVVPQIKILQAESQAILHNEELEKRKSWPIIGLGVNYMINKQTMTPKMESMNGKNMVMLMFKTTLPLDRGKYKANISSVKYQNDAVSYKIKAEEENLEQKFLTLRSEYVNKKNLLSLYNKQILLIDQTIQNLRMSFVNNTATIEDLLLWKEKKLDYKFKIKQTVVEMNKIIAKLKTITENYEGF